MARTAYFDCFAGASGDMLVGSLLNAGLDEAAWRAELEKLPLSRDRWRIDVRPVRKQGIAATKMTVFIDGVEADSGETTAARGKTHRPGGWRQHTEGHGQASHGAGSSTAAHHGKAPHPHGHVEGRGVREIHALLDAAEMTPAARRLARDTFWALAVAEGTVHGIAPEAVHFHEVGAVDAILDIAGFAIGFDLLGIERAVVSPVVVGSGTVRCAHGVMPVPAPAVLELLRMANAPLSSRTLEGECLTPTGAAILTTIADAYAPTPPFSTIEKIGYGAGARDNPDLPNVVRLVLGTT